MRIAVFPGSFDPITKGHESIVRRAIPLFDQIIIAIGENADKRHLFSLSHRKQWIEQTFSDCPQIKTEIYTGLTVDFCKKIGANFILRGLRTAADFEFERAIGQVNKELHSDIETIFLLTAPEHSFISSSIVRDVFINHGDTSLLIPQKITLTL